MCQLVISHIFKAKTLHDADVLDIRNTMHVHDAAGGLNYSVSNSICIQTLNRPSNKVKGEMCKNDLWQHIAAVKPNCCPEYILLWFILALAAANANLLAQPGS